MSNDEAAIRVGLAGATGAVGEQVLAALDGVPWRPTVLAYARAASTTPRVTYGDDDLPVDDLADLDAGSLDALIVALPREAARAVVDAAAAAGCPVVDLSGFRLEDLDTPIVLPSFDDRALTGEAPTDVVTVPGAAATLLASVLGPVSRAAPMARVEATVMLPASAWGHAAVGELSRQVVSLFNSQPPPRKVFPHGLAFDLLPGVGPVRASGWTEAELRATAEIARLTGLRVDVTLVGVPVFSGVSATLRFEPDAAMDPDTLGRVLSSAGVGLDGGGDGRTIPRPRRVEGHAEAQVTRIRPAAGGAVHLWAAQDNLAAAGASAVRAVEGLLRRREVLSRDVGSAEGV